MKKLLVVILAASMLVAMFTGCSKAPAETSSTTTTETSSTATTTETSSTATTETTESSAPAAAVELKDFSVLAADVFTSYFSAAECIEEFYAFQAFCGLMEAKGVNLVIEWVPYDQYQTTLQTRFGAMNDIPYYVSGYAYSEADVLALADQGIVLDINELLPLGDGTAASFFGDGNDFGKSAKNKVTTPDGNMYWLPNIYLTVYEGRFGIGTNYTTAIRGDWLDAQGLAMPTTTEDFKNQLATFNCVYGGGVAGTAVYSTNPCTLQDSIMQWYGLVRGMLNVNWDTGEATSPWLQDTFADYITYVNDLYKAGLYDSEMIGSNDTLRTKIANNQVGALSAWATGATYEPLIEAAKDENGNTACCYNDIYPITAIEGVTPLLALEDPVYIWDEFFFTNQCTDKALAAAFLDAYYCDDHLDLINYGVEGVHYNMVNGERQWITYINADGQSYEPDCLNQNLQEKADERISIGKILYIRGAFPDYTYNRLDKDTQNLRAMGWSAQKADYQAATVDYGHWTSISVSGTLATASKEENEAYNSKITDLDTLSQEAVSKLVTDGNIADIPGYVAQLRALGLDELVAIYQARYDRFVQ